ncbi:hypothetical protein SLE2022_183950 [Rubroshorea leprosula]
MSGSRILSRDLIDGRLEFRLRQIVTESGKDLRLVIFHHLDHALQLSHSPVIASSLSGCEVGSELRHQQTARLLIEHRFLHLLAPHNQQQPQSEKPREADVWRNADKI